MNYKSNSRRKVAVASSDGISINEHFGNAKEFWIYEVFDNGEYNFLERREAPQSEANTAGHGKAMLFAELLQDVEAVLAVQAGKHAEWFLQCKGIKAYALNGKIDAALQSYGKRSKIIRNISLSDSGIIKAEKHECSKGCK